MGIVIASGILNIACFFIGAKIGQTVQKGEKIETPSVTQAIEKHKDKVEQKREQSKIDIMLENINNYDGTGAGQKDIPD